MQTLKFEAEDTVRARAHAIWEMEGRPDGRHEIHWQRALNEFETPYTAAITDVSLIDGVGPKITAQLASVGVNSLQDIAKLTVAALADIDAKLNLKGRSAREEWIAQAKELIAGKAPRAKVDQAKASKAKA
jgi:predicted flap endonuclease-1-like 5' DNA nuclease